MPIKTEQLLSASPVHGSTSFLSTRLLIRNEAGPLPEWFQIGIEDIEAYECAPSNGTSVARFLKNELCLTNRQARSVMQRADFTMAGLHLLQSNLAFMLDCGVKKSELAADVDLLVLPPSWLDHVYRALSENLATPFRLFFPLCRLSPTSIQRIGCELKMLARPFTYHMSLLLGCSHIQAVRLASHVLVQCSDLSAAQICHRIALLRLAGLQGCHIVQHETLISGSRSPDGGASAMSRDQHRDPQTALVDKEFATSGILHWLSSQRLSGLIRCQKQENGDAMELAEKPTILECGQQSQHSPDTSSSLNQAASLLSRACGLPHKQVCQELSRNRSQSQISHQRLLVIVEVVANMGHIGSDLLSLVLWALDTKSEKMLALRLHACLQAGYRPPVSALCASDCDFKHSLKLNTNQYKVESR